jgi:hypothetical protein
MRATKTTWYGRAKYGRILVTHDADFLRFDAAGLPHAGIAYCAQGKRTIGYLVLELTRIADATHQDYANRVLYL